MCVFLKGEVVGLMEVERGLQINDILPRAVGFDAMKYII